MTPVPAKRLSLSEVLALVLSRGNGAGDSVTLSRNARGETQIEVTVRTQDGETVEAAGLRARAEYDIIRATYPLASGYVGAVSDPKATNGG